MKISLIAAVGRNNELGNNNQLLWNIKEDMNFFKQSTIGHTVIMGKNTFLSIGKALPKRINIVLSTSLKNNEVIVCRNIDEVLNIIKDEEEVFVIGGAKIYELFLPYADNIYLTLIDESYNADTFFPLFDKNEFKQKLLKENEDKGLKYKRVLYKRKEK